MESKDKIISEIQKEYLKKEKELGSRNYPDKIETKEPIKRHGIVSDHAATTLRDWAFSRGNGTWAHIAIGELSEAICASDTPKLREELVELAAVLLHWINDIDQRTENNKKWVSREEVINNPILEDDDEVHI